MTDARVAELKDAWAKRGGDEATFNEMLGRGVDPMRTAWIAGEMVRNELMDLAESTLSPNCLIEYQCWDNHWRDQGHSLLQVVDWFKKEDRLLTGRHLIASDGYYQHYAEESLNQESGVYHLCQGPARSCRYRMPRGSARELVHIDKWRLRLLEQVIKTAYSSGVGLRLLKDEGEKRELPLGNLPLPAAPQSGEGPLDQAVKESKKAIGEMEEFWRNEGERVDERETRPRQRSRSRRRRRGEDDELGDLVQQRIRAERSRKRSAKRTRSEDRRHKRKERRRSSRDSRSEDALFRVAPARGGREFQKVAEREPGRLVKEALIEMGRYLEGKTGEAGEEQWKTRKFMAYINQIMLVSHPPGKIGVRNHREVITVGTALDLILEGRIMGAADLLVQRLKALEQSFTDNTWATARHQELIPPSAASISGLEERDLAMRAELKAVKLKEALEKRKK